MHGPFLGAALLIGAARLSIFVAVEHAFTAQGPCPVGSLGGTPPTAFDGEIVVRPIRPHVMYEGYWSRPQATLDASRNLWFHTGDIGRLDEDDFLYFVDRKADYLRRRGENISSFEVERVLMGHGGLADVAVHAVPSDVTEDDLKKIDSDIRAVVNESANGYFPAASPPFSAGRDLSLSHTYSFHAPS